MAAINNRIPFRCNLILQLIEHRDGLTPEQLYEILQPAFGTERQCTVEGIDEQMTSIKSVGLVEITETLEGDNNQLISIYRITDYGLERSKKYLRKYV